MPNKQTSFHDPLLPPPLADPREKTIHFKTPAVRISIKPIYPLPRPTENSVTPWRIRKEKRTT